MSASSQQALLKVRIITSYKERVDKARKQRETRVPPGRGTLSSLCLSPMRQLGAILCARASPKLTHGAVREITI
jgi:hypothetical protein